MSLLDIIIIAVLVCGAFLGFKRGIITSSVMFVGTIIVIVLAYYLKNPISKVMYTYLPFFKFDGIIEGVSVINILIYEAIAFLVAFSLLMILYKIIILATRFIEKLLKATVILGIPSKILGGIFGLCEYFVILFVILFCISQFNWFSSITKESKLLNPILTKTPILGNIVADGITSITEITDLEEKYRTNKDSEAFNKEALEVLLKKEVITPDSVRKLVLKGKINIKDIEPLLEKYEKEKK